MVQAGEEEMGSLWTACKGFGTDSPNEFMKTMKGLRGENQFSYPSNAADDCKAFAIQWQTQDTWTWPKPSSGFWYSTARLENPSSIKSEAVRSDNEDYARETAAQAICVGTPAQAASCAACAAGTYSGSTDDVCRPCPAGTYSAAASAVSDAACIACEAGSFSSYGAAACIKSTAHAIVQASTTEVCGPGYMRVCSESSATASISGAVNGNTKYTLLPDKINGKIAFQAIPDDGDTRQIYQLKYDSDYVRWVQYIHSADGEGQVSNFKKGESVFPASGVWSTSGPAGSNVAMVRVSTP
jgi:hypothetical protein